MFSLTLSLPIRVGIFQLEGIQVTKKEIAFQHLKECAADYREKYKDCSPGQIEGVGYARRLFRALGIEPTKHRPSSEALLRRGLKQKQFYSVNSLVDICNWCALDFLLPNGVYDFDKLDGAVELRQGKSDESYMGLNHRQVNLTHRYTLSDQKGPFGSPITDSLRAAVDEQTTRAAIVLYAPQDYDLALLETRTQLMAKRMVDGCSGKLINLKIIDGKKD